MHVMAINLQKRGDSAKRQQLLDELDRRFRSMIVCLQEARAFREGHYGRLRCYTGGDGDCAIIVPPRFQHLVGRQHVGSHFYALELDQIFLVSVHLPYAGKRDGKNLLFNALEEISSCFQGAKKRPSSRIQNMVVAGDFNEQFTRNLEGISGETVPGGRWSNIWMEHGFGDSGDWVADAITNTPRVDDDDDLQTSQPIHPKDLPIAPQPYPLRTQAELRQAGWDDCKPSSSLSKPRKKPETTTGQPSSSSASADRPPPSLGAVIQAGLIRPAPEPISAAVALAGLWEDPAEPEDLALPKTKKARVELANGSGSGNGASGLGHNGDDGRRGGRRRLICSLRGRRLAGNHQDPRCLGKTPPPPPRPQLGPQTLHPRLRSPIQRSQLCTTHSRLRSQFVSSVAHKNGTLKPCKLLILRRREDVVYRRRQSVERSIRNANL